MQGKKFSTPGDYWSFIINQDACQLNLTALVAIYSKTKEVELTSRSLIKAAKYVGSYWCYAGVGLDFGNWRAKVARRAIAVASKGLA
jgi:hypothetical protein